MKTLSIFLICVAAFAPGLRAQNGDVSAVSVELVLDQDQFLSNEDLRVAVRITNRSGQTLDLGKGNDWLTFTVQARDNYVVSQIGAVPVAGEFSLDSSFTGTKRVNLTPYFDFRPTGRYEVIATVKIPQWKKEITSAPKVFDVISGTKLREFDFGVPQPADSKAQPEMRKYILQQAIYLKKMKLYLRLTDSSGATMKVFPLSPMVSFSSPEAQVDRVSNLHVLSQIGARSFSYSVINPDGDVIRQEVHDYSSTRPVLRVNGEGKISVVGGTLRLTSNNSPGRSTLPSPEKDAPTQKP